MATKSTGPFDGRLARNLDEIASWLEANQINASSDSRPDRDINVTTPQKTRPATTMASLGLNDLQRGIGGKP
jgi:hypothetical protein